MGILKKSTPTTEPFRVPSLTEVSGEYAAIIDKQSELQARQAALGSERRALEAKIAAAPAPAYRPGVAELLGESVETTSAERARLKEIAALDADIRAALEILKQRQTEARGKASLTLCDRVKPEYARRVAAICKAFEAVDEARLSYQELIDQLERHDVSWGRLGPMQPNFLGDARDGHVQRYIREAKGFGYYE